MIQCTSENINKKYGNWTVNYLFRKDVRTKFNSTRLYANCTCTCGIKRDVRVDALKKGKSTNCGCIARKNRIHDLTGKKFGRLFVVGVAYKKGYCIFWNCKCDCGKNVTVYSGNLKSGTTKSCGCYKLERVSQVNRKHGCTETRLYRIYEGIKNRCYNEKEPAYKNYGARGIKVCAEWINKDNGFENFKNWAENNGYSDELSIDRIDVNNGYSPLNCRWANLKMQANNKRTNKYIEYKGQRKTMSEWADETGISYKKIQYRLSVHKPLEEVFRI